MASKKEHGFRNTLILKLFGSLSVVAFVSGILIEPVQGICPQDYHCLTCNDSIAGQEYCTSCIPTDGLTPDFPTKCQPCGSNCANCTMIASRCLKCYPGFGPDLLVTNTSNCAPCSSPNCISGCDINGAAHCDLCQFGYRLEEGNTKCNPCIAHCRFCGSNITYCDQCNDGYYLYPNKTCGLCASNCTTYKCPINGPEKCDRCDKGFGLTEAKTCAPCASNCESCTSNGPGKCDECNIGYGLTHTNTCEPCASNCSYCNIRGAGKCDKCELGFGLTPTYTCAPCDANCNQTIGCNENGTCIQCNTGYALYQENSTCGACDPNCNNSTGCITPGTCTTCLNGYELTASSTCSIITTAPPSTSDAILSTSSKSQNSITTSSPNMQTLPSGATLNPSGTEDTLHQNATLNPSGASFLPSGTGMMPVSGAFPGSDGGISIVVTGTTLPNNNDNTTPNNPNNNGNTSPNNPNNNGGNSSNSGNAATTQGSDVSNDRNGSSGLNDWRILLTMMTLIFGGLLITLLSCCCWCTRFHPLGSRRRYRRYLIRPRRQDYRATIWIQQNDEGVRRRNNLDN